MIFYPKRCYIQIEPYESEDELAKKKQEEELNKLQLVLPDSNNSKIKHQYKLWRVVHCFGGGGAEFSKRLTVDDIILVENNMVQEFQGIHWIHENHVIGVFGLEN